MHIVFGGCHDSAYIWDLKDLDWLIPHERLTLLKHYNLPGGFKTLGYDFMEMKDVFRTRELPK